MANPLSPLSPSDANRNATLSTERRGGHSSSRKHPILANDENRPFNSPGSLPSSPFVADRTSTSSKIGSPSPFKSPPPRKGLPTSRPQPLTANALRENEGGMRNASDFNEANIDPSIRQHGVDETHSNYGETPGYAGMDDTCFSTFSAVPNADMTRFANLGGSPSKFTSRSPLKGQGAEGSTPRSKSRSTPPRRRDDQSEDRCSPTPRQQHMNYDEDTTNLLVDFTDQFSTTRSSRRSPTKSSRSSPLKSQSHKDLSYASSRRTPSPVKYPLPPATPSESRHLVNLLDFDLTPARTPRSIPSITARELESMKSNFLSQISSLTATLSGREAEVKALSNAVTDAERRVGEAMEEVRNERQAKVALKEVYEDLEKRQTVSR